MVEMNGKDQKTLFLVMPYGIGWTAILNEKVTEYFTSRKIRLVIIAESPVISISHPLVHVEKLLPYDRSKFEIMLGILRNFVFADTSRKHTETLELKIKVYEQHNTMIRWMRKLFGKRLSKSKYVKSLFAWLDLNAFGDKSYENLFEKYKPDGIFVTYPVSYYVYPIQRRAAKTLSGHSVSFLHCVTIYPTPLRELNLARMNYLRKFTNEVGFSDHTLVERDGTKASVVAISLGARVVERHFTVLDRSLTKDGPYR